MLKSDSSHAFTSVVPLSCTAEIVEYKNSLSRELLAELTPPISHYGNFFSHELQSYFSLKQDFVLYTVQKYT